MSDASSNHLAPASEAIRDLVVRMVQVASLRPNPRNPRIHSKKQIRQIAGSIKKFGWVNPIIVDEHGHVIAGHGRLEAGQLLGFGEVPVICITDMTMAQRRAYALADNKLAENAGWDDKLLALELRELLQIDPTFEITLTGFEMGEIDALMRDVPHDASGEIDEVPEADPTAPVISRPGDLWRAGPHRLLCADTTKPESLEVLMQGQRAEMVFADPPYNVPIQGHVTGSGRHAEFAMASGEMSEADFIDFLATFLELMVMHCEDGAIQFVCMDWRHLMELLLAGRRADVCLQNLCVWAKTNAGMGSLYRSQHELVAVFKAGVASPINNVELGRYGRHRSNVWAYPGMNSFGAGRDEALAMHPTVKPVGLVEDAILDCSNRNGIILDPFAGSGTTIIAAERVGRRAFCLEIEPRYVDVALRRFRKLTGMEPVHADSGATFGALEEAGARLLPTPQASGAAQ